MLLQQLVNGLTLGAVYTLIALYATGIVFTYATLISVLVAFLFRVFAVRDHWPQIVPFSASDTGGKRAA